MCRFTSAMLIWGFSFLAIKDAVASIPIFPLLFFRFAIATIVLAPIGGLRRALSLPPRDLAILAGLSALSPIGYFIFETYGVAWTQPSHVSVIVATIPIAVYIIAFAKGQERPTLKRTIGILTAYGGILLIIGLFSLFIFGPLAATSGPSWLEGLTLKVGGEIVFLGVLCSAGAFFAMHYALSHLSATQVAVTANLVPIVTLFAEASLLGIGLTLAKSLGTLLTVAGVIISQIGSPSEPIPVRGG